ncbi:MULTISPECIES: hypothetical protein [unclassified Streptomyces]|uniref:hypothetical protein n=1 Tax=unclassified Streptomyces TaxID=2593676 RepID=UPI0013682972|nr:MULTISPECIES: hypothetical protein [unclassified Streptomyces]NDZ99181.1 hypothetical protein [Streptomyces sp. SID10116]MYY80362.1 hypothetical protein [Streptomyces sp. SID335]MYZ13712.1 hypothetical protein [Streptomyces sp. SID337]NDZ90111.1 hypothetical protein [Streptomyces sp. SID10115]NEB50099.1 hypothetical protein [Streptomyces sp. SID339]
MPVDGTPERAAERIVEFARAGVARLVLGFPDADWRTRYELAAQAARAVRVHRAWVHEVDANERVFREAGRQAVTEAPTAGHTGVAERAGGQR